MPVRSCINFQPVKRIGHAVRHNERTEEIEPTYLLPKDRRAENEHPPGNMTREQLTELFEHEKGRMTGQAKARGSSPFWEGVMTLDADTDAERCMEKWKPAFERMTGMRLLHYSVHNDEGHVNEYGETVLNRHLHVIVNRMKPDGRLIQLGRKQLSELQDMTAREMEMERGETLAERRGVRGRKHLSPHAYREFRQAHDLERSQRNLAEVQRDALRAQLAAAVDSGAEATQRAADAEAAARMAIEQAQAAAAAAKLDATARSMDLGMVRADLKRRLQSLHVATKRADDAERVAAEAKAAAAATQQRAADAERDRDEAKAAADALRARLSKAQEAAAAAEHRTEQAEHAVQEAHEQIEELEARDRSAARQYMYGQVRELLKEHGFAEGRPRQSDYVHLRRFNDALKAADHDADPLARLWVLWHIKQQPPPAQAFRNALEAVLGPLPVPSGPDVPVVPAPEGLPSIAVRQPAAPAPRRRDDDGPSP